ncbi:tetratricopeptide repeat protein [Nocardia thailandica]
MAVNATPAAGDNERLTAGYAAYQRGDTAAAQAIFEEVAAGETGRLRTAALINAASMADERGEHRRAVELFRTALAEMPDDAAHQRPAALVNLSQAFQHLGELDAAAAVLEEARTLLAGLPDQGMLRVACLLSLTAVALHRQQWARASELAGESLTVTREHAPALAGHPLMNLAASAFETGRTELAFDFAAQAMDAFREAGDAAAVAETQQNLATMYLRAGRHAEAGEPLAASQDFFERAGLAHRVGVGAKIAGFLAESGGDLATARARYRAALDGFAASGAIIDAADVRVRLATVLYASGAAAEGEALLAESFAVFAAHGLGLHCAQLDYWHAELLDRLVEGAPPGDPASARAAAEAARLAVPAALTIDAVRHTLPNGRQRDRWHREIAAPAMRLAFRFAVRTGDARLVADLVETQCAGTSLDLSSAAAAPPPVALPYDLFDGTGTAPDAGGHPLTAGTEALRLGAALADVAAAAGIPVAPPPRLVIDGRPALADYIALAEARYGRTVRDRHTIVL